jgi:NAD(P)-dependent dehydrogenase (short-subunit alcohol dehydrogenase family)
MDSFVGKLVLVTGAGSGIGRETARAFSSRGARIIATDIQSAGLAETQSLITSAGGSCETHVVDVGDEAGMRQLADTVLAQHGALDVLVNNAGIGAAGRFLDTKVETWDRVLNINVKGVLLGCKLFLPAMIERGRGHIVNLASMAGYFPAPDLPIYCASKYAVLGFSEALRGDMKDRGIGVSAICPGVVNTNIVATTTSEGKAAAWQGNAVDFYRKRNYPPSKVARAIVRAVEKNIAVLPVTPEAWFGYYLKRFFPGLARGLAAKPMPFMKTP